MATLTQDQINKLKQSGLNDNEISSLAQKNGFSVPQAPILSSGQVYSLKKSGLNDSEIGTLAEKNGFSVQQQPQDGFIKSTLKDVAKTLLIKPAIRTAQALGGAAAYAFGNDAQKAKYNELITKDVQVPGLGITVEGQRKFGEGGATQIGADVLKTASNLYGGQGAGKVVSGLVKGNVVKPIATGAFTGAVGGTTYGVGQELENPNATVGSLVGAGTLGGAMGAVVGGTIPAVGATIKPTYKVIKDVAGKTKLLFASPEDKAAYVITKRTDELANIVNKNNPLKKLVTSAESQGYNPIKDLSDSDLLVGAVNKDGRIDGKLVQERFNEVMDVPEGIIKKKFEETGEKISLDQVQARMAEVLNSDYVPSKIYKQVQNKYDDIVYGLYQKGKVLTDDGKKLAQDMTYIGDNGERIPYMKSPLINFADLQQEKIDAYKLSNFLDPEKTMGDKAIGRAFKVAIDQDSKSIPELAQINKELGRYLSVKSLIDKLDQKVVKGGRLGKYFAQAIGAMAGSAGGPIGSIVGAEAGGAIQGQILKGTFGKAVGKDIFEGSLDVLKNQSNKVDALQIPQAKTTNAVNNVITESIPNKPFVNKQGGFISTGNKGNKLYHGTADSFDKFDTTKMVTGNQGKGIYMTDNPKLAEYYSMQQTQGKDMRAMKAGSLDFPDRRIGEVKEFDISPDVKIKTLKGNPTREEVSKVKSDGYDGVRFEDVLEKEDWDSKLLGKYPDEVKGNTTMLFDDSKIIYPKANTKQGMSAINPLTVIGGGTAIGAGIMSNKKK